MKNPWTNIPAEEYEKHMSEVGQLQLLNSTFKHYYDLYNPKDIIVLGATTGNGFENIKHEIDSITAIDINNDYLLELKNRFPNLAHLSTICGDIQNLKSTNLSSDFVYAALIFEYVDLSKTMLNIKSWLKSQGKLISVLQMPNKNISAVSPTRFKTLGQLSEIMKLIDIKYFEEVMNENKFRKEESKIITLQSGKQFYIGVHSK
jgi:ubiquinone/menaquinone biosynthesis C-methylase UbiE